MAGLAAFRPRVQCGECDYICKEGREMDTHRAKKHKKKECEECHFVAELSIVFRRHKIQKHHQKCKSCEFTTATPSALKVHEQAEHGGGVLRTSAGFMITSDASNDLHRDEAPPCQDSADQRSKRKPTKSEYLRREKEVNIENKSRKDIVKSFKDAFKNMKKKIANLQKHHGAQPEYIMISKNNVQNSGGKNPSPTGDLYIWCVAKENFSQNS